MPCLVFTWWTTEHYADTSTYPLSQIVGNSLSRLDFCNFFFISQPLLRLSPFKSAMNAAVRLIHLTSPSVPATPNLSIEFHLLCDWKTK